MFLELQAIVQLAIWGKHWNVHTTVNWTERYELEPSRNEDIHSKSRITKTTTTITHDWTKDLRRTKQYLCSFVCSLALARVLDCGNSWEMSEPRFRSDHVLPWYPSSVIMKHCVRSLIFLYMEILFIVYSFCPFRMLFWINFIILTTVSVAQLSNTFIIYENTYICTSTDGNAMIF